MISLLVFDVDGSLTDGSILYTNTNTEIKSFNVKDGLAISTWNKIKNKKTAFITGRKSDIVKRRAQELGVTHIYQGVKNKKEILKSILKLEKLSNKNVAILGDDLNDYSMMNSSCMTFCPNDASFYIKEISDVVLKSKGGKGAGREMVEYILKRDPFALKDYLSFYMKTK